MDYKYIEIVRGSITNRGNVYEYPQNWKIDYFGEIENILECYHSVFVQSQDYIEYQDKDGGKTGYKGNAISDMN